MEKNKLDLAKLKKIIDLLMDQAMAESEGGVVEIPEGRNFYWEVSEDSLYSMAHAPLQLGIGSLWDDYEFLEGMLSDIDAGSNPVVYMLVHAAPLFRYLAELPVAS